MLTRGTTGQPSIGAWNRVGPPSSHARRPSGSTTSPGPSSPTALRTEVDRPIEQRPPAAVHGVAGDQVVQRLTVEREARPELVGGPVGGGVCRADQSAASIVVQLDDQASTCAGRSTQVRQRSSGLGDVGRRDGDRVGVGPLRRRPRRPARRARSERAPPAHDERHDHDAGQPMRSERPRPPARRSAATLPWRRRCRTGRRGATLHTAGTLPALAHLGRAVVLAAAVHAGDRHPDVLPHGSHSSSAPTTEDGAGAGYAALTSASTWAQRSGLLWYGA